MTSPVSFKDFRRWFERHGVYIQPCGGGGSHYKLTRVVDGKKHKYIIPTLGGRQVKHIYISKARKALRLTALDGIEDDEFFN